ncbi:MAG TPA: thiamine phosphate synthase [Terriglobales bacterium]|jgi:thiamine-phosphate pyrophosphorylase|nr:thiamine phosphate synthase [Terriglobales bacterium]
MLLYYITDRSQFSGDADSRRAQLLATVSHAARCGVDYIQLREKDLSAHDLELLAREIVQLRTENSKLNTGVLINTHTDIALACGANGVHLRSDDISPAEVRAIWSHSGAGTRATIGVSCHTRAEVACAAEGGADFAVFGPVFEKYKAGGSTRPTGLEVLHEACQEKIPVIALGGVTLENASVCIQAGAAGLAGIRLFQQQELDKVVAALRRLGAAVGQASDLSNPRP